jgi:outer membrane protein assembly factor BamA
MINPSIGNGGGLGVLYARTIGENDKSPPSTFGFGGFATNNGSWGGAFGSRLYLNNDKYRITVAVAGGQFNYNYFGIGTAGGNAGTSIPLGQKSKAFLIEPKIRFYRRWYAGPRYHIIKNDVYLNSSKLNPEDLPIPLPSDLNLRTAALGGRLQRDTSDSAFYPTSGSILDVLGDLFGPAVGGQKTYQGLTVSYNKYLSAGLKNVFAIRGSVCLATVEAPFYDLCALGSSKDIRGYQIGQFRDNRMIVGQAEYRRELFWRLGAVAFAGAGAVAPTWGGFGNTDPEPGGGFGLRFLLAKKNHINLRADYAWGNNSHATYILLGEAF